MTVIGKLTVYFEEPFWVGVCERYDAGQLEVSKVVFGAQPKEYDVYDCFVVNWRCLRFSPQVAADAVRDCVKNPKRMQRSIQKLLASTGISTKAQMAVSKMREQSKQEHNERRREQKREAALSRLALNRQKKKEKHKGH